MDDQSFAKRVRTMQIINFALVMGVVTFLGFACFIVYGQRGGQGNAPPDALPMITFIALAMFVPATAISFVLPGIMIPFAMKKIAAGTWQVPPGQDANEYEGDAPKLLAARQQALIISLAILEGNAFLACIAFFVEARIYALALTGVL